MSVPSSLSELESRFREGIDANAVPSVAYGIWQRGETVLLGAAGVANKEMGTPATPATAYSMASVTKPMTTTGVMLLAERGLIDLQAPMNRYLGEAKIQSRAGDAEAATVWTVADHTAGLPLHYQFYYADEPFVRPPMDESIRRYAKTFTPVGERHHYSNLGYGLLDDVIERRSGRGYADFMANEVFGPLGMSHASIDGPGTEYEAVAYGPDGVGYPHYTFDHPGGSAAYASVEDLILFGQFHLGHGPALFSPEARRAMQHRTARIDETRGYGFGWGVNENRFGRRIVQHTGGMGGVNTILRLVPELDLVIVVLVNGQSDLPFRGADDALAAIDERYRDGLQNERDRAPAETETDPVPPTLWGRYDGTVETHVGGLRLILDVQNERQAVATLNGEESRVDELQMRGRYLLGVFDGNVGTDDASRRDYRIHLDLTPSDEGLRGAAVTVSKMENGGGGAPGKRMGNALAYWTDLRRI